MAIAVVFFFCGLRTLKNVFMYTVFPLRVLYPEHSQLAFDCTVIACSFESIRPGLVQGCKAPMVQVRPAFNLFRVMCTPLKKVHMP